MAYTQPQPVQISTEPAGPSLAFFSHRGKENGLGVFAQCMAYNGFSLTPLPVALAHWRGLTDFLFIERVRAVSASVGWQLNDDPVPRLLSDSGVPWNEAAF